MSNVAYLPIKIEEHGPARYATPCPVYVHPLMCMTDGKGRYPLIRQLERETGMTGSIDERFRFTLTNGVPA